MNTARDRAEMEKILELGEPSAHGARRWLRPAALIALVLVGAVLAVVFVPGNAPVRYQTAAAARGSLTVIVTATGALQPTDQVDVGSELSGTVKSVEAEFNDAVQAGQVLARLDTTKLGAQVLQSEAALRSAQARMREAAANEDEMRRRHARAKELFERKFVSEEALFAAQAAGDRAVAALESARAQVEQARATLVLDRTNLGKASIRSPIDGTVLVRKVEPGQTVAATLQAPVLFTIAHDLTKMELHVDVDEADVGQVSTGQSAVFTVDAYSGQEFAAVVSEVRNAAKTVSGVVTYETLLSVDNPKLLLRPGMTGTANIRVRELSDVLLVPNAALRFTPPASDAQPKRSFASRLMPGPPRPPQKAARIAGERRRQQVWALQEGAPAAIPVTIGATDGRMTQVTGGGLQPGTDLITGVLPGTR